MRAYGGSVVAPAGFYVRRLPPTAAHFASQRIRQAYDELAQPVRLLAALLVLPGIAAAVAARRPGLLCASAAAVVGVAEAGRRKAGGRAVFPSATVWLAPLWLIERGVCSWLAVAQGVFCGGVRYAGGRLGRAAHSTRALRRQLTARARSQERLAAAESPPQSGRTTSGPRAAGGPPAPATCRSATPANTP